MSDQSSGLFIPHGAFIFLAGFVVGSAATFVFGYFAFFAILGGGH